MWLTNVAVLLAPPWLRSIRDSLPPGYAADDGAALHFRGAEPAEMVTSRQNAAAYRVELAEGQVVETRLEGRYLGG